MLERGARVTYARDTSGRDQPGSTVANMSVRRNARQTIQPIREPPDEETAFAALREQARLLRREAHDVRARSRELRTQLALVAADIRNTQERLGARNSMASDGRRLPLAQILKEVRQLLPQDDLLRRLSGALLTTIEEERSRVARELHDDLNQSIAFLQLNLATLRQNLPDSPDETRTQLQSLTEGLGELSAKISQIARQLHPPALQDLGLEAAMRSYVTKFAEKERIKAVFRSKSVPREIPSQVGINLYRILQEALHNASKYARTERLTVSLSGAGENQIRLVIRDHGVGLDPDAGKRGQGLGLISMEERAKLLHGVFQVSSRPGRGTQVEVEVPI